MTVSPQGGLETMLDAVADYAIIRLEPTGVTATWNHGAEILYGFSAEEIIGRPESLLHTGEDQDAGLPERALTAARQDGRFAWEGWRVRKNGKRFWASVVITPIRDQD